MKLKARNKGTAILSDCCESPFGYVRNGRVTVTAKHDGEIHMLILFPDDLRKLANEAAKTGECGRLKRTKEAA